MSMTSQQISLEKGWNWLSFNVEMQDASLNGIFGSLLNGDFIKSQLRFSEFYEGFGFFGQLETINTDEMYAARLGMASTLSVSGSPVALPKSVTLGAGW
jgi:trimeric autotransporter adhesin